MFIYTCIRKQLGGHDNNNNNNSNSNNNNITYLGGADTLYDTGGGAV